MHSRNRPAGMLTGVKWTENSQQGGSEEETKVRGRNDASCSGAVNVRPQLGSSFL